MDPKRLGDISRPLDKCLERLGFRPVEKPVTEGSVRIASFALADDFMFDYTLDVKRDNDRGQFRSDSDLELQMNLYYKGEKVSESLSYDRSSANMPAPELMEEIVNSRISGELRRTLRQILG